MKEGLFCFSIVFFQLGYSQNTLMNTGSIYMHPGANLAVFGDFQNDGTLDGDNSVLHLSGTTVNTMSGSGTNDVYDLSINNSSASGINLSATDINIHHDATFIDGVLYTTSAGKIIFEDNATASDASTSSFVEGPVSKIGNDAFIFPTGRGTNYAGIEISAPAIATDSYTAVYFDNDPQMTLGNTFEMGINHISTCEYWTLERDNGTSTVSVTLNWNLASCGVSLLTDLLVARWDSTEWKNHGNGGTTGNTTSGNVISFTTTNNFGAFTLGSLTFENILPIGLLDFKAIPQNSDVLLSWETATEIENDFFNVQRSSDGITFETISTIDGAGNSNSLSEYRTIDSDPLPLLSYYRLKQTDVNGHVAYSDIKSVQFASNEEMLIFPNPSTGESVSISVDTDFKIQSFTVVNENGAVVYQREMETTASDEISQTIYFNQTLCPGVYTLIVVSDFEIIRQVFIVV